jgi:hypothetical protein
MGPGAPGLDESVLIANNAETYQLILDDLIANPEARRRAGTMAREQILNHHDGNNWQRQIQHLYKSDLGQSRGCIVGDDATFEVGALNLALVRLYPKINTRQLIAKYVGPLPYSDRISITCRLFASGFGLCFLNLLPASVNAVIRAVGRRIKGAGAEIFRFRK